MIRRLADAVALNVGAAITFHTLTLACRLIDAKRRSGRDGLTVAQVHDALAGHCRNVA